MRMHLRVCWRLLVVLLQMGPATCVAAELAATGSPVPLQQTTLEDVEPGMEAAAAFRGSARLDFTDAVVRFAAPEGAAALDEIGKTVWAGVDAAAGWSHFMTFSIIVAAGGTKAGPLVAFYSPWSDVFLMTRWATEPAGLRIRDAELLLGDWVRRRGAPPFDVNPLWLRGSERLPAAPAIAAADAILALEAIFADWNGQDWRARMGGFGDAQQVAENRSGASLAMRLAIQNALLFLSGDGGESSLRLRIALESLRRELSAGRAPAVLASAKETSPAMKNLLRNIPGEEFKRLVPIAAFIGKQAGVVYMAPRTDPDYYMAFRFKRSQDRFASSRLDFISYQQVYEWRRAEGLPSSERNRR